jgi:glucokinase
MKKQTPGRAPCLALDVGGTKIEAAVVHPDGSMSTRRRLRTEPESPELLHDVLGLLRATREQGDQDVAVVGVGCGGPMSGRGRWVSPLNIPAWRDLALREAIEEELHLSCFVDNDAKALALAEGCYGAAVDLDNYLSMVVSTGIGGGLVIDGDLLDGRDGNAGHIGHVIVEPDGRECACGSRGCLEAEASGPAIAAISGRAPSEADEETKERTGRLVGRAVASAASLLDFRDCFVAGSVALGFGEPFFRSANDEAAVRARIAHAQGLRITASKLGEDGPLLGAAMVAWRGEW